MNMLLSLIKNIFVGNIFPCLDVYFSPDGPGPVGNGILFKAKCADESQSSPSRGRHARKSRHRRNNSRGNNVPNGMTR